jgi:hypothetical protein
MATEKDGFGHEKPNEGETNDWITPKWIIKAFDSFVDGRYFDLDPCVSMSQPWPTAKAGFNASQDGLLQDWSGKVYCNPPYGPHTGVWMRKMAKHNNGIALVFARVETAAWQDDIFPSASGFIFPRRRIQFARPDGTTPKSSSGAPSAFISWGANCRAALIELCDNGRIEGAFLDMAFYTGSRQW